MKTKKESYFIAMENWLNFDFLSYKQTFLGETL